MNQDFETYTRDFTQVSFLEAIYSRRAVRSYSVEPVADWLINELLDAAIQAPSAMNSQPWAFVVIKNTGLLKEISDKAKVFLQNSSHWSVRSEHAKAPITDPSFDIFYGAKTLIVVCATKTGFSPAEDCYLAAQNLMLTACGMGLGSCPIGFVRDVLRTDEFQRKLSINDNYTPVLPIIVGHPMGASPKPERRPPEILSWIP